MHQIQLTNTAFEGRNSVYLLGRDGPGPTALVDTGVATPDVRAELETKLAAHDVGFADLDVLFLTHWHHDHAGLAGAIQAASDATVYAHEADAPLVRGDTDALDALEARQTARLDEWGLPDGKRTELESFLARHADLRGDPVDVTPVRDGRAISVGDWRLEVEHLPGHAAGLVAYVFEREDRREAFVGDAILPKYTPNVGGADVRVEGPLAKYLDSLQRIVDLDLDRAWPGHRGAIVSPTARAKDIAAHHETRTERVLGVVREREPVTAWAVSEALFGELSDIHILHGPGESFAHLDYLDDANVLEATPDGYVLLDDAVTAADVLEGRGP